MLLLHALLVMTEESMQGLPPYSPEHTYDPATNYLCSLFQHLLVSSEPPVHPTAPINWLRAYKQAFKPSAAHTLYCNLLNKHVAIGICKLAWRRCNSYCMNVRTGWAAKSRQMTLLDLLVSSFSLLYFVVVS